jgi:predicted NAD-dependent protein-ADP-ribosyltransferase YbiA (DUF1768 family)
MDILSDAPYPASALSNFAPHAFVFDGVNCASAEGPLQSFKFEDESVQQTICLLSGIEAKKCGRKRNKVWRSAQCLWWKGVAYSREGSEYQKLLDRLYDALFANAEFRTALLLTGNEMLRHSVGYHDPKMTILTEEEFCSRLTKLRERLLISP